MRFSFRQKNRANSPIYCVITHCNDRKYFNTNIIVDKKQFKDEKVVRHNLQVQYNLRLNEIASTLNQYIASKKDLSISEAILLLEPKQLSFIEFIENNFYAKGSTHDKHITALNYLKEYDPEVGFSKLSHRYVSDFVDWLKTRTNKKYAAGGPNISHNYINTLLSVYSSYSKMAIKRELLTKNYFIDFKLERTPKVPVWLTMEEIERLERLDLSAHDDRLAATRDSFVLCCFMGLRAGDFSKISIDDVVDGWICVKPEKVDKYNVEVNLPLHKLFWGRPLKMLEEVKKPYFNTNSFDLIGKIVKMAGIEKKVTWHVARHSFAMNLLNLGLTLEAVQSLLGHKSITTTEIYARLRNDGLEKRIDDVFGRE